MLAIAEGLGGLLHTAFLKELDRQQSNRSEVKALRHRLIRHFLLNTLNIIASLTRTNPNKARDLLREFSVGFITYACSSQGAPIPLSQELDTNAQVFDN